MAFLGSAQGQSGILTAQPSALLVVAVVASSYDCMALVEIWLWVSVGAKLNVLERPTAVEY